MDKEIEQIYNGSEYPSIFFAITSIINVEYTVTGSGTFPDDGSFDDAWKIAGPVEGAFSYHISGKAIKDNIWEGHTVSLEVNGGAAYQRYEYEPKGFLGIGTQKETYLEISLYVKP